MGGGILVGKGEHLGFDCIERLLTLFERLVGVPEARGLEGFESLRPFKEEFDELLLVRVVHPVNRFREATQVNIDEAGAVVV